MHWLAEVIGGVADSGISIWNAYQQNKMAQKNYNLQKSMNAQSQYNFENQMSIRSRDFENAGLNKNLLGGSNMGSLPSFSTSQQSAPQMQFSILDRLEMAQRMEAQRKGIEYTEAQKNLVKKQEEESEARKKYYDEQSKEKAVDINIKKYDFDLAKQSGMPVKDKSQLGQMTNELTSATVNVGKGLIQGAKNVGSYLKNAYEDLKKRLPKKEKTPKAPKKRRDVVPAKKPKTTKRGLEWEKTLRKQQKYLQSQNY